MQDRRVISAGASGSAHSAVITAGGLIYVSGLVGTTDAGVLAGATIDLQTRRVLDRLQDTLRAAGSSLAMAANLNVYLKHSSDFDAMNTVYRTYFPTDPPARTTVVADLPGDALVEISAVAVPTGGAREVLLPAGWPKSPRPYSYIVRTDELVFFSGLLSRRGTDDKTITGDITLQTKTILDNASTLLTAAGLTMDDVVAARVFLTDDTSFDRMNAEYHRHFLIEPPARATTIVGLMSPDATIEISLIASTADKQVLGTPMAPSLPFSAGIRAGRWIFLSGVVGNTVINIADTPAQARECLKYLAQTLEASGASFADVVDSTVYLTHLWQTSEIDKIYRDVFPIEPPARTIVGASMVSRGAVIEILVQGYK